eukprot:6057512-Amphidinium_carterae.1
MSLCSSSTVRVYPEAHIAGRLSGGNPCFVCQSSLMKNSYTAYTTSSCALQVASELMWNFMNALRHHCESTTKQTPKMRRATSNEASADAMKTVARVNTDKPTERLPVVCLVLTVVLAVRATVSGSWVFYAAMHSEGT